jgi:hypothetical protein
MAVQNLFSMVFGSQALLEEKSPTLFFDDVPYLVNGLKLNCAIY